VAILTQALANKRTDKNCRTHIRLVSHYDCRSKMITVEH